MNAMTADAPSTVTLVCAWCRRDSGAGTDDARAIVGLCENHVRGFFTRVEELLASCAALRKKKREAAAEAPVEDEPEESLADVLRRHGGLTFCDPCLAAELDWPATRVTGEAERLDRAEFVRDQWRCARCGARGLVTRARTRRSSILEDVARAA